MDKQELEGFRDIKGYEGIYEISNLGRLKSLKFGKERIMIKEINSNHLMYCMYFWLSVFTQKYTKIPG